MLSLKRWIPGRVLGLLVAVGLTVSLGACGDILGSEDPDVVTPGTAQGPAAIPVVKNGIIGNFQGFYDNYVLYTGMLTDEYILAGTFPTRQQVDQRNMGADNATLNGDMWEPIQSVLQQAKDANETWTSNLGNSTWQSAGVVEALPVARFYAGYATLLMAEAYCNAILNPRAAGTTPVAAADSAIALLQSAETAANNAGNSDIAMAATVGQARAEAYKGDLATAAGLVGTIPDDFVYIAEYSSNSVAQENEVFQFNRGINEVIRWTVGDGSLASRDNEAYEFYTEWNNLGLVVPRPDLDAFDSSIPVHLEQTQLERSSAIPIASGWEANAYEIENTLRTTGSAAAQGDANALVPGGAAPTSPIAVTNQMGGAGAAYPPSGSFSAISFAAGGATEANLRELGRFRQIGLWQSGTRLGFVRRVNRDDGFDLYPARTGDDTCFPVTQQEIDDNPNFP